jgi:hypothetical protein
MILQTSIKTTKILLAPQNTKQQNTKTNVQDSTTQQDNNTDTNKYLAPCNRSPHRLSICSFFAEPYIIYTATCRKLIEIS